MDLSLREVEYLRALFTLTEGRDDLFVSVSLIARYMGVKQPTAIEMLRSLHDKGYAHYVKKLGCKLSSKGKDVIEKLTWKHRTLEALFYALTGEKAEFICSSIRGAEMFISDELLEIIDAKLGRPEKCPCGRPIPRVGR